MRRTDSLEKTLMLGKIEGRRRRGQQRMKWIASQTQWTWVWVNSRSWWWTGRACMLQSMESQSQTWLSDWTELNWTFHFYSNPIRKAQFFLWLQRWNLLVWKLYTNIHLFMRLSAVSNYQELKSKEKNELPPPPSPHCAKWTNAFRLGPFAQSSNINGSIFKNMK